jgi:hypothetical protein
MEFTVLARQALLFAHVITFAIALATVIKEDVQLVRAKQLNSTSLHATAELLKWALVALWATGIPMVIMDTGIDISLLPAKPKLFAKLIVVTALTLNGVLLHRVAFPILRGQLGDPNRAATIAVTFGAVSTASWLYASFVGVARIVAPYFSLYDFVGLYVFVLAAAISFANLVFRNHLRLLLMQLNNPADTCFDQQYDLSSTLLQVESAIVALSEIQRRLRTSDLAEQLSHIESL